MDEHPSPSVTRRRFLITSTSLAGGLWWLFKGTPSAWARAAGLAQRDATIIAFTDAGVRQGRSRVPEIVKTEG